MWHAATQQIAEHKRNEHWGMKINIKLCDGHREDIFKDIWCEYFTFYGVILWHSLLQQTILLNLNWLEFQEELNFRICIKECIHSGAFNTKFVETNCF